jgi:hypothetical protein
VERAIVHLSKDDWDQLDTRKIPTILVPTKELIERHYGSAQERTEHLLKVINTEGPVIDKEPPNWVQNGVGGISKAALMESLHLQHVSRVTPEQQKVLDGLEKALLGGQGDEAKEDA